MFPIIINLILILLTTIFLYFKVKHSHWSRLNIQTPKISIPFGHLDNLFSLKDPFFITLDRLYKEMKQKHVKVFGVYYVTAPEVVVVDLDTVKNILVKDFNTFVDRGLFTNKEKDGLGQHLVNLEGHKWKNLRSKLTPVFTSGKMKGMFPILLEQSKRMISAVHTMDLNPLCLNSVFTKFAANVIGTIAFGMEINTFQDDSSRFAKISERMTKPSYERLLIRLLAGEYSSLLIKFGVKKNRKDLELFFTELVQQTLEYRKTNNVRREDFVQILADLQGTEDELSMVEMVSQAYVFFIAGYVTSAMTSAYCCLALAGNQDVQDRLREEINEMEEFTYENLHGLKYLSQCIQETSRLYPFVPELNRISNKDYKIPGSEEILPKGTRVMIPILSIHHDEEYYPDPTKFDPDRFSDENKQNRHQMAYLPFGHGPRSCIGERFGLMQTKLGVATMIKNYRLSVSEKFKFEYDPIAVFSATKDPVVVTAVKI